MHRKVKMLLRFEFLLIALVFLFKFFLVNHFYVHHDDMYPNIHRNDIVFYKRYSYGWSIWNETLLIRLGLRKKKTFIRKPANGDLVLFYYDCNKSKLIIRRVIATEGESVEIENGVLKVNSEPIKKILINSRGFIDKNGKKIHGSLYRVILSNGLNYKTFEDEGFLKSNIYNAYKYTVPKNHVLVHADRFPDNLSSFAIDTTNGSVALNNLVGKPFAVIVGSQSSPTKSKSKIVNILLHPYNVLKYIMNIDITRIWKSLH